MNIRLERELEACAAKAGVTIERIETGGKHNKVYVTGPLRSGFVTCSISPSDRRAFANITRDMKRAVTPCGA